jgi:hypothetical protein
MLKFLKCLAVAVFVWMSAAAQNANADTLFTNWSGTIVGGNLYTGGGPCSSASCFALAENFSNQGQWNISDITIYIVSLDQGDGGPPASNWRFAVFTAAGDEVVAPTDTAVAFTDLGNYFSTYDLYKGVITGLNIDLPAGEYWFRFTNTQSQAIFPAYGSGTSSQTISPGLQQLTGSSTVESLLSTDVTQRTEEWAFELGGTEVPIFSDGFEGL